ARRQAGFAAENLRLSTELLRIAETRRKAGESGELELSQARADASLAAQEQNRLNHEERLMLERLRSLMGMAAEPSILEIRDPNREMPGAPNLKAAINEAVHARADVRAAELAVIAAGKRTGLAKAEVFSLTSAIKFTDGAGTQPGFDLPIPIFNQNQAARVLADARLQKALRQLAAARHRAAAETREALARLRQAKAVFQGWQSVLPELETALEKARKAVTEGAALPFLALDAARRLAEARSKAADSDFQQQAAAAELRRALGKI
ncbi:MAG: TolC family protein, partial [Verrucomicrobiales bacterium]|nr:TolC family protein [Verrucomicrobiales bacterium]